MTSIRLSLIVYFSALLLVGLGAVCLLFYMQTQTTLEQKEESTRMLYVKEFQNRCSEAHSQFDKQLVQQTRFLASRARGSNAFFETLVSAGSVSSVLLPGGQVNVPLVGLHPQLVWKRYNRGRPFDLFLAQRNAESREDAFEVEPPDPAHYQLFAADGELMQQSSLESQEQIKLDDDFRRAELYTERLDMVSINGQKFRRVTFKGSVPKSRLASMSFSSRWVPQAGFKGGFRPRRPSIFDAPAPVFYLMCEESLAPVHAQIARFQSEFNTNLADLKQATQDDLSKLNARLWWIALATFAGLVVGGFGVLCLGLRPLNRLSDAVSRVNERDFELHVSTLNLPSELRPIADRLKKTLEQLGKAFEREKQASADISHELRTPLSALLTNLEVALRKPRSAEQYREVLEECRGSGQQMYHLVERLLSLARLDAGAVQMKNQILDVSTLARQCANLVKPIAEERGLSLRVHADTAVHLKADPDKLREVLTNLLHNAIEYNRPEGSIHLSVRRENGHVQLEVRDTGIGISPKARERIFERFFRADPSRQADTPHAGLGLAIVKSYVDLMGGTIDLTSGDEGSTFCIALPAGDVASMDTAKEPLAMAFVASTRVLQ